MDSVIERMFQIQEPALGRAGQASALSRAMVQDVQSKPACLHPTAPDPTLGLRPAHLPQLHTPHCSGTKAAPICEKGEKRNSVEFILLVSERLALAPEWGSHRRVAAEGLGPAWREGRGGGGQQGANSW